MPNAVITVYLPDADFVRYVENKEELNERTREYFKMILSDIQHKKQGEQ